MSSERRSMSLYERALEAFGRSPVGAWYVQRLAPKIDPTLLRLTGGRVSSIYPVRVMLLTTMGAKSFLPRTHPLLYIVDGDALMLIASNYGRPSNPAWYRNLVANPEVKVVAGGHSGRYTAAEITDPEERDRAWAVALDTYAGYSDYEVSAGNRTIPLIRLARINA